MKKLSCFPQNKTKSEGVGIKRHKNSKNFPEILFLHHCFVFCTWICQIPTFPGHTGPFYLGDKTFIYKTIVIQKDQINILKNRIKIELTKIIKVTIAIRDGLMFAPVHTTATRHTTWDSQIRTTSRQWNWSNCATQVAPTLKKKASCTTLVRLLLMKSYATHNEVTQRCQIGSRGSVNKGWMRL